MKTERGTAGNGKEDKKQRRAYGKVGDRLRQALKADGIANAPKVATLLLDTFVTRGGVLKAVHAEKKKLCGPGVKDEADEELNFSAWRKKLENLGWISYDSAYANRTKRYSDHEAGHKLKLYINDAKKAYAEFATMDDVRRLQEEKADRSELEEIKTEMEALKKRLTALEAYQAQANSALERVASSMLGPNARAEEIAIFVREMLRGGEDEDAAPVKALLAN